MTEIERCKEFYSKYPDGTFADSVEAEFARDMFYAGWDAFAECVKEAQQVPDEPTDAMLDAGAKMFAATLHSAADFKHHAYHVYMAMISASPNAT